MREEKRRERKKEVVREREREESVSWALRERGEQHLLDGGDDVSATDDVCVDDVRPLRDVIHPPAILRRNSVA